MGNTLAKLSRDPISLAAIYQYFPDLVNFFFEALAISADYSNNGLGGGQEDELNDPEKVLQDLLSALGNGETQNRTGEKIFTGAWELINTAQRIDRAIKQFPFRQNIPPKSPDIFHLRIGASNFYIPPLKIDVNTNFKVSSLGAQGLRQKNSAKFNAGYKETSIGITLFFPNYEEIWGLSIEEASKITVKDNYVIDFKENGDSDDKIDKFLSSLRGLVAAFKYSPILPIKNQYLNSVYNISGVALSSMSISTIENYPFGLRVDLNLNAFNHKPFLPMISDFNQAVHWGKYRQYMGKAAGALHNYVNEEFLLFNDTNTNTGQDVLSSETRQNQTANTTASAVPASDTQSEASQLLGYKNDVYTTNVYKEWTDGSNITFYVPAETQTKIFTPDISDFRSEEEKLLSEQGRGFWQKFLGWYGLDTGIGYGRDLDSVLKTSRGNEVEFTVRQKIVDSIDILTAGKNSGIFQEKAYSSLIESFIAQNRELLESSDISFLRKFSNDANAPIVPYNFKFGSVIFSQFTLLDVKVKLRSFAVNTNSYLDYLVDQTVESKARNAGKKSSNRSDAGWFTETRKQVKDQYSLGYTSIMYERFFKYGPIRDLMEAARERNGSFHLREWEVPMIKMDLDRNSAIVTSVSVTMSNNLVPLQLQMQEEPTFQHIGSSDSYINIQMTVFGEKELIKLRKMFDHINGLARLEHATGVIGFLGIKNIISALAGIKYVLPIRFDVQTIDGFPHVYNVSLRMVDFDIFQQKREQLSSDQQRKFIEEFGTKKNPFLRIKQLWGQFNCYPDFPLEIRDKDNEVVGTLDPDFYFRSFEMFDRDVVNNITVSQGKMNKIQFVELKPDKEAGAEATAAYEAIINGIKTYIRTNDIIGLKKYVKQAVGENVNTIASYIKEALSGQENDSFLLSYVNSLDESELPESDAIADSNFKISQGKLYVGDVGTKNAEEKTSLEAILKGSVSLDTEEYVSFDPDDIEGHGIIHTFPAVESGADRQIPSVLQTADGYQFGYIDKDNGRFYLTVDGFNVTKENYKVQYIGISDQQTPDVGTTKALSGVAGVQSLDQYQYTFSSGDSTKPETMSEPGNSKSMTKHWEKMMIDTSYRDISGRMLRAFPTYMLWLIDEGNFAGTKLFDNFYGLQSVIDFSIVQSEDILGDTLILRVSNMYAKLSTKEATAIIDGSGKQPDTPGANMLNLTEGLESVIDLTLNRARNMLGHMDSQYIVDIENIRLKPGVRVHLRGGYGANPNGLQTLFNGVITEVELGEIVTVTAQSDAIELSPIVNSTNQKGHSGKIDGGINTGMYLSEPRDLMVRLLSMGTTRWREAFAHSTRGTVFSQNKFGIRHFGSILYEPLSDSERNKNAGIRNAMADAAKSIGNSSGVSGVVSSAVGVLNPDQQSTKLPLGPEVRIPVVSMMQTLWANFGAQRDLELFKRNIYPGNGTGVAQFLGGDLGDGWSNVASLTPEDNPNPRLDYLNRLTDASWNDLMTKYETTDSNATAAMDSITLDGKIRESGDTASKLLGGALLTAGAALAIGTGGIALPVLGTSAAALGLTGVLGGRGGKNIFKTLGLVSDLDDDMPGFDEISFRAQTYMKSVWELFQTCARLLPNYIVAVRPFEDRSTIFYGKPHWLYTSGVVPITTGFPSEDKAVRMGLKTPSYRNPDAELLDILTKVNKNTNSSADYLETQALLKPPTSLESIIKKQTSYDDIYKPAGILKGSLINITDEKRAKYIDSKTKEVVSVLPKNKGFVTIGYHLPIDPSGASSEVSLDETKKLHRQIDQIPARFSFPYFTDRPAGAVLLDYAFFAVASKKDDVNDFYKDDKDYEKLGRDKNWNKLIEAEAALMGTINTVSFVTDGNSGDGITGQIDLRLDQASFMRELNVDQIVGESFIYDLDELEPTGNRNIIRMPLPSVKGELTNSKDIDSSGSWEYKYFDEGKIGTKSPYSYKTWGSPKSSIEEQFYIAMRWPYKASNNPTNDPLWGEFKREYFSGKSDSDFYGKIEDYKKRRILVYSPTTNQAVVCQPAYFLWGKTKVDRYVGAGRSDEQGKNRTDTNYLNFKYENEEEDLAAVVSPDAAYYLGVLSLTKDEEIFYDNKNDASDAVKVLAKGGVSPNPQPRDCYFVFVDDNVPLGVVSTMDSPVTLFTEKNGTDKIIGFGKYVLADSSSGANFTAEVKTYGNSGQMSQLPAGSSQEARDRWLERAGTEVESRYTDYVPSHGIQAVDAEYMAQMGARGGNYSKYFSLISQSKYSDLSRDALTKIYKDEIVDPMGDGTTQTGRVTFSAVFDIRDPNSVKARELFDEDFSSTVSVLAGNGRTLRQANQIWDQFRAGYHTYNPVKEAFGNAFSMNPDSEDPIPEALLSVIRDVINNKLDKDKEINFFKKFNDNNEKGAVDEFTALLGSDFINASEASSSGSSNSNTSDDVKAAIEYARSNFLDAPVKEGGLIPYFNSVLKQKVIKLGYFFKGAKNLIQASAGDNGSGLIFDENADSISAKQLFYLVVGIFRQTMWQDPYARAWLVLKPNRQYAKEDDWDFSPVTKIFAAFIDPNQNYSSDKKKFLKLLVDNKSEGNSAGNIVGVMVDGVQDFYTNNIGPIWNALTDGLSGLLNMFRVSMLQMGYGLDQVDNFAKQANILNKALNDSIYYSLGRPGSLLRAVDNPFTREYGEPVVEIREPFQRMHYISSFSHILANNIKENTNGVATQITAVSDGKYPVTVALDKSIPSERQVEQTVETGLYFDNVMGSGIFGIAQPLFNPIEFARGAAKLAQGAPDELSARRVALAHLRESLKDIYGGELILMGSPDIRPHDLVYLADVYERMYGIFEVEQVVHHFTSDMGFITSITPNALVSVNDPGRWFLSSWMHSWFSIQNIRNDTRMLMNAVQAGSTGILSNGNISVDGISQAMSAQMLGGLQFTQGSSALMKDIIANFSAEALTDAQSSLEEAVKSNAQGNISLKGMGASYAAAIGGAALVGSLLGPIGAGVGAVVGAQALWGGWKWVRDNVLDQHGCYIQYLNKNGQPMDAGLSINSGMVVGRYHSKKLLPGILGVKSKVRTTDGHLYIRSDDVLKALGWKEKQINDLVRYVSLENSLVNAEVLKYSGTSPDKASFSEFFKIVCKLHRVISGDEIEVVDIFNPNSQPFKVKLDGIFAGYVNMMNGYTYNSSQSSTTEATEVTIINTNSPGARAGALVQDRLANTIFVIRVSPNDRSATSIFSEQELDAGSSANNVNNYLKGSNQDREKALGVVFYRVLDNQLSAMENQLRSFFLRVDNGTVGEIKNLFKNTLYEQSSLYKKFDEVFNSINRSSFPNKFVPTGSNDPLNSLSQEKKNLFTVFYYIRMIEILYSKASQWPYIGWDEYYEDGGPASLNWELVVNNLAQVDTRDLLRERDSVINLDDQIPTPTRVS